MHKFLRNTARIVLATILGAYLLLLLAVNYGPVQEWLGREAAKMLSEKVGAPVEIGRAELGLFNKVTLHDVKMQDRDHRDMLDAKWISGKIEIRPLLEGKVRLRSIGLLDAKVNLSKADADSPLNCQFVIDAFKKKEEGPSELDLRINSLIIRRVSVHYNQQDTPRQPNRLDPRHLYVSDIDANLSLKRLTNDSIHLRVRSFSAHEQSGFDIKRLRMDLHAKKGYVHLARLLLELPQTRIEQDEFTATFSESDIAGTLRLNTTLKNAIVSTDDIAPLVPRLANLHETFTINTKLGLNPALLQLTNLDLANAGNTFHVSGNFDLLRKGNGIGGIKADVGEMRINRAFLSKAYTFATNAELPVMAARLGDVAFKGKAEWQNGGATHVAGDAETALGNVKADVTFNGNDISGKASTDRFALASLLDRSDLPDDLAVSIEGKTTLRGSAFPLTDADVNLSQATFRGRTYRNIHVKGRTDGEHIEADIDSKDPSAVLTASLQGTISANDVRDGRITANISHLAPEDFGISTGLGAPIFNLEGTAQFNTLNLAQAKADLNLSRFSVKSARLNYALNSVALSISPSELGHHLLLDTDFASADIDGPLAPEAFKACVNHIMNTALPQFASYSPFPQANNLATYAGANPQWKFRIDYKNDEVFNALVRLPVKFSGPISAYGHLRSNGRTTLNVESEKVDIDGNSIDNASLYLNGEGLDYTLLAQGEKALGRMHMKMSVEALTRNEDLDITVNWADMASKKFHGEISTITSIDESNGEQRMFTMLRPSEVFYNDSVWDIASGNFIWDAHSFEVQRFKLSHEDQILTVNGRFSKDSEDAITANLQRIDLDYVFNFVHLKPLKFDGLASGQALITFKDGAPDIRSSIHIEDFMLNDGLLGEADITGGINLSNMVVDLHGIIRDGKNRSEVEGTIPIADNRLNIGINADNMNIRFLQRYIGGILKNIEGRATGYAHIGGTFKDVEITGDLIGSATGELPINGCEYVIDKVHAVLEPTRMSFSDGVAHSPKGGTATIEGTVLHDYLRNWRYTFNFNADNMLIYDRPRTSDLPFAATAYGSGLISIDGKPGDLTANFDMRPEKKTTFTYYIDSPDDYSASSSLLTFRETPSKFAASGTDSLLMAALHAKESTGTATHAKNQNDTKQQDEKTLDIHMNMLIDMQPDVGLRIIMDEKSGDDILIYGSSPISATYYNKGNFQMFGTFNVDHGTYRMSIQDVIRKDFTFEEGSSVEFNGKPFDGILHLNAVYTVPSASLGDLNLGTGVGTGNVRADCTLAFNGKVSSPEVKFGLRLPTVSDDVTQMVKSLISTDEEMNRQILYLLAVGRFYTYDYANTTAAATQSQSTGAVNSFISNTLSGQINNVISNAMGSSNWTFGTNVSTGNYGWTDMQALGLMSGRLLNNRLLVNGNFGYRSTQTNTDNFVGDFDVQYLLTKRGEIRLKAYNETNDRYFTKNSLTTQGVGIVVQRNFNNISELFSRKTKRNKKKDKTTKKEKGTTKKADRQTIKTKSATPGEKSGPQPEKTPYAPAPAAMQPQPLLQIQQRGKGKND